MLKRNTNLIVKLVLILLLAVLILLISAQVEAEQASNFTQSSFVLPRKILVAQPKLYPELEYAIYYDPAATEEHISKINKAIKKLERINYSNYTSEAAEAMSTELDRLRNIEAKMASDLSHYLQWESEYYYATKVWEYFRQRGFNNEVTCAIIGNMMIETSGGSLDLNPTIYSKSRNYYGLCQWALKYCPNVKDMPFEAQLDYLLGSMPWEFNTFGRNYKSGFKYDDFIIMTDVEEAALAFTKSYERCSPISYEMRQEAAVVAYEYFDLNS